MRTLIITLGILCGLLILRLCFYTVDATEYVYVTVLGQHVVTHDGKAGGAGLHFGWPWPIRMVQRLDNRLQVFDLPAVELLTPGKDKSIDKTLLVEAYVCWQLVDGQSAERFIQSLGTVERAQAILQQRINSLLGATMGRVPMNDLFNTAPGSEAGRTRVDDKMDELRDKLMTSFAKSLHDKEGIELKDVRLRRLYHPGDVEVKNAIYARIRSERDKVVEKIAREGKLEAAKIEIAADEAAKKQRIEAAATAAALMADAESAAATAALQPAKLDPELYSLLQSLKGLERIMTDNKSLVLLSTRHPFLKLLTDMPRVLGAPDSKKTGPEPTKGGK
jgi:membrane protease subunit HflC